MQWKNYVRGLLIVSTLLLGVTSSTLVPLTESTSITADAKTTKKASKKKATKKKATTKKTTKKKTTKKKTAKKKTTKKKTTKKTTKKKTAYTYFIASQDTLLDSYKKRVEEKNKRQTRSKYYIQGSVQVGKGKFRLARGLFTNIKTNHTVSASSKKLGVKGISIKKGKFYKGKKAYTGTIKLQKNKSTYNQRLAVVKGKVIMYTSYK